jgi:pyruvate dehydrogenase E1 component beta subunit
MMKVALSAADELAKDGVQCEVIDLRTISPLDIDTIVNSVKKTNRLVIVEESWPFGSIASEITFQVQRHAFDYLDAPIKRVTGADSSMHYAPNLVEAYLPNPTKVIAAVRSAL